MKTREKLVLINHLISTTLNYESIERFLRSIPDLWFFFDFSVDTTKTFQDHFRANYWNKIKGDRARTSINNNEGLKALEEVSRGEDKTQPWKTSILAGDYWYNGVETR
jgi:hypothetical protein